MRSQHLNSNFDGWKLFYFWFPRKKIRLCPVHCGRPTIVSTVLNSGGKPSTWLPPGGTRRAVMLLNSKDKGAPIFDCSYAMPSQWKNRILIRHMKPSKKHQIFQKISISWTNFIQTYFLINLMCFLSHFMALFQIFENFENFRFFENFCINAFLS